MSSASARPLVTVQPLDADTTTDDATPTSPSLPNVMKSPIRPEIVAYVHSLMAKNSRQPSAVSRKADHQTSAESWGTGRAVSRTPRVPGGDGAHKAADQGAFGNIFARSKIWRRWHRKRIMKQERSTVVSDASASSIPCTGDNANN